MRALKTKIRGLKKPQFERLKKLTHHAKNLYNPTLWTLREAFEVTGLYFFHTGKHLLVASKTAKRSSTNCCLSALA